MGLLDRLVSDLIKDSTGYDPRRIVRRIGGGKLLMAGGAALAGALVVDRMQRQGSGSPSAPAPGPKPTLPPVPPGPSQPQGPPELPPLPPLPQPPPAPEPTPAAELSQDPPPIPPDLEYAIVRTLIAGALADGHLGTEEKELVLRRIDEAGLPAERRRQLHRDLVLPPTPSELAALAPSREERETLYSFASLMTRTDAKVEARETEWLDRLAGTLEIPRERRAELAARAAP